MSEATQILETIVNNFSVEKFCRFFREKSQQFVEREENYSHYNDIDFKNGLKLGEINFLDGDCLVICAFEVKKELSERSGKKAQYQKAKDILKSTENQKYSAGIFIFYDANGNFRFSLVYPESIGTHRQWNNFRRFTYFVSREFTNKTFKQRIGDGNFLNLEKIKDAFSVEKVTAKFYESIANWYFWAVDNCQFPKDAEAEENGRNIAVIRLITRMIFIWFMREKDNLIPNELFKKDKIQTILKDVTPNSTTYYKAILQNLFFATLSTKKNTRDFRDEKSFQGKNKDFGNQYVYRYHDLFSQSSKIKTYFDKIPFLNGGLFECLDDGRNNLYIDGFTERKNYQPNIPNFLFFSQEKKADLNKVYGTKNKTYKVTGLLDILSSFNFTIDENSPDDQDVALDPELLGRVFENLLASFNPETSTTARKATGSYYTPREIVDYMVTESLKAYFKTHLSAISELDKKIDLLFSTGSEENPFSKSETKKIVELIESVRIVDPAVGSGAFPMGALNKLVFILNKVDPGNELWKLAQLSAVDTIPDPQIKQDIKNRIEDFFKGKNADYGRKLYLIQKCIYGVDIQQIAVEIAKLRFFISLLVDEKIDKTKENWGIEPLPNLDFKIMQGNSLISEFLGIDFDNGQEKQGMQTQVDLGFENKDDNLIKEFERKKIDFQNESDKDKKLKLKNEVEDLMIKLFESKVKKQKASYFKEIEKIELKYSTLPNKKSRDEIIINEKQKLSKKSGFDLENIEKQLREFSSKRKVRPFFPWKLYFAEVFDKGGFDIVIGNPPYGIALSQAEKQYFTKKYISAKTIKGKQKGSLDTFSIFIEQGFVLLKVMGNLIYIVPMAVTSSDAMTGLHNLLEKNCSTIKISSYSNRPRQVFDNACIRTSILFFIKTNSKTKHIYTTKMIRRKYTDDLSTLIGNLKFIDSYKLKLAGRYPKISTEKEFMILEKIFRTGKELRNFIDKKGKPIYYRTSGGRYFNVITNYKTNSTKEKPVKFNNKISDFVGAILSSNLFYYYQQVYTNGIDLKQYEIESFPIPVNELNTEKRKEIEIVYKQYLADIEKNANVRVTKVYANIDTFKEYKICKSKHLINKIDDIICPLYGLTQKETDFIKNYEIEFRLSGNDDN